MKNHLLYVLLILSPALFCGISAAEDDSDDKSKKEIIDSVVIQNGVTITEIEESGRKKYELTGTHGESLNPDVVRLFNVKAVISQKENEKVYIMTDSADFNQKNKEVDTDEYVEIMFEEGVITGIGMKCEPNKNTYKILNNVKITLYTKSSDLGVKLPR